VKKEQFSKLTNSIRSGLNSEEESMRVGRNEFKFKKDNHMQVADKVNLFVSSSAETRFGYAGDHVPKHLGLRGSVEASRCLLQSNLCSAILYGKAAIEVKMLQVSLRFPPAHAYGAVPRTTYLVSKGLVKRGA
jgi:hypothetical protein